LATPPYYAVMHDSVQQGSVAMYLRRGMVFGDRLKRFALCYRTVVLSVCNVGVLWPNSCRDQDETCHADRPLPWPHSIRWGPSSPPQKGGGARQFSAPVCCGQMAAWINMSLGMEVGVGPGDFVLNGTQLPIPKKGAEHPFPIFGPCPLWPNGWMD